MSVKHFISVAAIAAVTLAGSLAASTASAQITIPTVHVGNPGNAPDTRVMNDDSTGYGSVAYTYNIGRTEVTNAQYAAFLNAKARLDRYGLYSPFMTSLYGGIRRLGAQGSYTYSTMPGRENNPVVYVSFWDACRFANWLHNGQGDGDTETGAYTLRGVTNPANTSVTRNAGALWAIPSESEWHKAAYHHRPFSAGDPAGGGDILDSYWLYPTSSDSPPTGRDANTNNPFGNTLPVGSFKANYYGTFDMAGNAVEWTESLALVGQARGFRGGSFESSDITMKATFRNGATPTSSERSTGFRVVQIPGPSSVALLAIGGLAGARRRRLR
jgi:sulfatase modifying factor 1